MNLLAVEGMKINAFESTILVKVGALMFLMILSGELKKVFIPLTCLDQMVSKSRLVYFPYLEYSGSQGC